MEVDDSSEGAIGHPEGPRPDSFPFSEAQKTLIGVIDKLEAPLKHRARNAIFCLNKSWLLAPLDPNIAMFRAITAEEEAATALIVAVRARKYPSADLLKPKDHPHKAGIIPFIRSVAKLYTDLRFPTPDLQLNDKGPRPSLLVFYPGSIFGKPRFKAEVSEPLDGVFSQGNYQTGEHKVMDFSTQLQSLAEGSGASNIRKLIDEEANLRNKLLYAGDAGVYRVHNPDQGILQRGEHVYWLLLLTIAIAQVKRPQLLAIQCVEAYLKALGKTPVDPYDFRHILSLVKGDGEVMNSRLLGRLMPLSLNFACQNAPASAISTNGN